jgi:ribulose 1,5-bisphosphate synthetase/thiazole synthase
MENISISDQLSLPVVCEADVVIAGAGPGGLGAALFSARAGARTVLV